MFTILYVCWRIYTSTDYADTCTLSVPIFLHSYDKQITSWLVRFYNFYYSLAVKDR